MSTAPDPIVRANIVKAAIVDMNSRISSDCAKKAKEIYDLTKLYCNRLAVDVEDDHIRVSSLLTNVIPLEGLTIETASAYVFGSNKKILDVVLTDNTDSPMSVVGTILCRSYYNITIQRIQNAVARHDIPRHNRCSDNFPNIFYIANKAWMAAQPGYQDGSARAIDCAVDMGSLDTAYRLALEFDIRHRMLCGKRIPTNLYRAWNEEMTK